MSKKLNVAIAKTIASHYGLTEAGNVIEDGCVMSSFIDKEISRGIRANVVVLIKPDTLWLSRTVYSIECGLPTVHTEYREELEDYDQMTIKSLAEKFSKLLSTEEAI